MSGHKHQAADCLSQRFSKSRNAVFIGETCTVRKVDRKNYVTVNKSMSVVKNSRWVMNVDWVRFAVFG